ncbi:MAG: hypothetical protein QW717_02200 [Candidatus Bathyarchaeia archaeon]
MLKNALSGELARRKELYLTVFLLINSLSAYFMERRHISTVLETFSTMPTYSITIFGIHDLLIIGSGWTGAWLYTKIKRNTILYLWMILGTISSALVYFIPRLLFMSYIQFVSFFWGVAFGFGMPSCLAYFGELTKPEKRGTIAGLIFFIASAASPLLLMVLAVSFEMSALVCLFWKTAGLILLLLLKSELNEKKHKKTSFKFVLTDRRFLLYIIPWFMFSCVYGFQKVTLEHAVEVGTYEVLRIIQSSFGAFSAILSGIICDRVGRKKVIIYGFVSLGIAYALVSIATSLISFYLYSIIDGIAWGIFIVMFVLVLWGDLSTDGGNHKEKYYAVGCAPFFFADFAGFLSASYIWFPVNTAFSVASFFLFIAVLPLMFAPETLPEKAIKEKELRSYIEKAKKIREKLT